MNSNKIQLNLKTLNIPEHVTLVAVSKKKSVRAIKMAYDAGQRVFGESYMSEVIEKIHLLKDFTDIQ